MLKTYLKPINLLPLLVVSALLAFAGSGHIFTSGKLSSSLINCVAQDRYGYIWVGTEYGLNKFDGYNFSTYLYNSSDERSITDNTITDFLVDHSGRLWIGSAKGLMRYDYHGNDFVRYPFPDGRHPRVYSLFENRQGDILIGSAGYGLYAVKHGTDRVVHEQEYSRRDSDDFFTHIYDDGRGNLWQSSHVSLFTRFARSGHRMVAHDYNSPVGAPVAFLPRRDGRLLLVCMEGFVVYDYSTDKISPADYDLGGYKGHVTINAATFDKRGNLFIGTSENGVLVAPAGRDTFVPYSQPTADGFDLTTSYAKDLMFDKDDNLWVGCYRKGLYLANDESSSFSSWSFSRQNYSIGSSVSSLARGDNGTMWCTVQNSGVFQFNADGKITAHLPSPNGTGIIYRDGQGHYWVGSGNGLYSYDIATGAAQRRLSYSSDGTYCMADDGRGTLFVSVYSKGLYVYDTNTGQTRIFNMTQRGPHGYLCNDWVRSMTVDHTGLLWIGTSNGVACMNPKTMAFDTFGKQYFLHDVQTNYLCEDNNGDILIGTDNGLYVFQRSERRVVAFPGADVLRGKQICGIAIDRSGDLWISTTMGIWQYDRRHRQFLGHIIGNGLMSSEYAQGAVLHDADDRIAFGTGDGITTFYPDNVRHRRMHLGKVYLTAFIVDGKPIDCLSNNFTIPYSENTFTLQFSLLNYKNPGDVSFQYRINGGEWQLNDEGNNSIPFVKLQPGKYVIDVRAYESGVCSDKVRTITISVSPPWYLSPLAIIIYILIIAGIVVFVFYYYSRRKKTELEESKMRFLIDATHDIKSPLTLIVGPLNRLKARLADDEESQKYISTIDHNANRLLILVNQILDERKIDKNQMRLQCQDTEMVAFVANICNLFRTVVEERNIQLRFVANTNEIHAWVDRINFDKVVSNLLSNAVKYTFDGGTIDVVVDSDGTNFHLDVMDTGIGLKDEIVGKVFDRFFRGAETPGLHIEGTGIGLNLCRNIVRMHGGTITAANRHDVAHGAVFTVAFPLGNAHLKPEEIVTADDLVPAVRSTASASKNYRILVVDDDREIALYINNELSHWYRFDYSPNGKDALKKLLTDTYDVVISDVKMPEMDGITLLKKIKNNSNISDIPVILLTSKADAADKLEGLKRGADAYLSKPFDMDELHVLIDNLVGNVRRLRGKYSGAQEQKDKVENVAVRGNDDVLMERIMNVVNKHISEPDFNVEVLTRDVGISRAQLHRKMKEMTGISAGEFIRNLRLEQAARLIAEGNINITQVAFAVGFNNQAHFSTVFKKHYGVTPTEYSEKHTGATAKNTDTADGTDQTGLQ